jgi:hypothetical protein
MEVSFLFSGLGQLQFIAVTKLCFLAVRHQLAKQLLYFKANLTRDNEGVQLNNRPTALNRS